MKKWGSEGLENGIQNKYEETPKIKGLKRNQPRWEQGDGTPRKVYQFKKERKMRERWNRWEGRKKKRR